jgi:hypothetical protein
LLLSPKFTARHTRLRSPESGGSFLLAHFGDCTLDTNSSPLSRFVAVADYRRGREHIYPSDGSVRWAVRTHRETLVANSALAVLNGRLHIDPEPFDKVVLDAGSLSAREAP